MNRRLFFLSLPGLAGCTGKKRPRLNVYNWSDYVAPDTIPNFEREFGVRVRYGIYESGEEMLAKVLTGNSGWDIVFPTNNYIKPMRDLGLLAPLDHARLHNLDQLDPEFRSPEWDPELGWCVPYMCSATGVMHQRALNPPPTGWDALWNERYRGRVTMLDDPNEVLGACLKKLGCSLNSCDPGELARAKQEALAQKRILRAYLNQEVRDQLVAGDVLLAQMWASSAQTTMAGTDRLAFIYPREGFARYADNCAILRESRRQELAHAFLDYLLRPPVAAAIAAATRNMSPNAGARRLHLASDPGAASIYSTPDVLARGEWFRPLTPEAQRLRDRIWTEIKAA